MGEFELRSVVIRYVEKHEPATETRLRLDELEKFDADYITEQFLQALKDLDLQRLMALYYDGGSVMSGKHSRYNVESLIMFRKMARTFTVSTINFTLLLLMYIRKWTS